MADRMKWGVLLLLVAGVGIALFAGKDGGIEGQAGTVAAAVEDGVIRVVKTPTCGCCSGWVDHLRAEGFEVEVEDRPTLNALKVEQGIAPPLQSCHTAFVNGYIVEGHVPASTIRKLLAERPDVRGIAVPGMPIGSPGMEGPNPEIYDVLTFDRAGRTEVFERIDPSA